MEPGEKIKFQVALSSVFRPGAPIDSAALFSGRNQQVAAIINAVFQAGQHVVMFGERGVGKTSLAKTLSELLSEAGVTPLSSGTVNCDVTDDFSSLWKKVFRELQLITKIQSTVGFSSTSEDRAFNFAGLLPEKVTPDDVRVAISQAVSMIPKKNRMVIVLDEVDRLKRKQTTTLLADTIKNLSDHLAPVTLILVGVADAVDQLIGEHRSIERSLVQVPMPRMSAVELGDIIDKGFSSNTNITIKSDARAKIIKLSQGLPHFTHLLSLESGVRAVERSSQTVELSDVSAATEFAVKKSHSLLSSYEKGTSSPQKNNLYRWVLLACAVAKKTDLGWFSAASVCSPLSVLLKRDYSIPYFSRHLNEFCSDKRGPILEKSGLARQFRFRFCNPLIQPFIIIHALSCGMIDDDTLSRLSRE